MATWSPEQLGAAAEYIQANIGNPGAIQQRASELGLSNSDLLQAVQTVNPNATLGQVNQYFGGAAPATPRGPNSVQMAGYERSPYLDQMAARIAQQSSQQLNEQILPGVRSQAVASGGYGGSRQGIAEGLAMGRSQEALQGNLANLYNSDYQADRNRALQKYGIDQQTGLGYGQLEATNRGIDNQYSLGLGQLGATNRGLTNQYDLGLRGLENQRYGIDQTYNLGMTNAANNRYGTDKSYEVGMAGANASMANAAASQQNAANNYSLGQQRLGLEGTLGVLDRQYQWGQGAINSANAMQNTPTNYWQQYSQGMNALGQNGGNVTTSGTAASNPYATMMGGAQIGSDLYNRYQSSQTPVAANHNVFYGTGSMAD